MEKLGREFYRRRSTRVAEDLLGRVLVHNTEEGRTSGVIVETEAYLGVDDPASHASAGKTERNKPMWGKPGVAYVYLIYGLHCLFNVVTGRKGQPQAVLFRSLEPLEGIALMRRRRGVAEKERLAKGPGNLSQAMGIGIKDDGEDLTQGKLFVSRWKPSGSVEIVKTKRVGVKDDRKLRFFVKGSKFVS